MDELSQDLRKRFHHVAEQRNVVQHMWDAIESLVMPYRGRFFKDERNENSIEWFKSRLVYDSTAVMAHQNLAASLHGALTSPSIQWFDMRFRDEVLNKNKAAMAWLQESALRVFNELQDSNFDLEINETYQDICGFGTSIITLEENPGSGWAGLNFSSVPLKEAFFEQDAYGQVLRFYRKIQWTPAEIISKFGDEVPENITRMEEDGNTTKQDVLFAVYPRHNRIAKVGERQSPSKRPWAYRYLLLDDCSMLGKEGGYYEMPAFAPRWRKTSSSVWGNSPAMFALGDIMTLNEARKMQLVAAEKLIDPPIFAEEKALIADLDLSAAALSVVRSVEGIMPFNTTGQISVSDHMIDQLQTAVRNYFFIDQINFPSPQAQPISATEAQIRYELMQRLLGPTLGRLQSDLLNPIVQRTFRMLARDGQIGEPPPVVIENNAEFDIEYMGALSRAQRVDNAAAVERLVGSIGAMAPVFPEMIDVIDQDAAVRSIGRDLNVPATIMRDEREVKAMRDSRAEQQQQMQDAMLAEQQGNAAKAMGEGRQANEG